MGKTTESSEPLTRKQAKKISKRKKLESLLWVTALNDQDRKAQINSKNHSPNKKIHDKSEMACEEVKVTQKDSKKTLGEECQSNSCNATIDLNNALSCSNDEPSPKRLKPDPQNTAQDEDMPLHCDVLPPSPPAHIGSSKHQTIYLHQTLPHQFPQVPQQVNSAAALQFQQNLASQIPKAFPHLINSVGQLQLVPALLVPEFWNIPGSCLNPMAISVLPSVYSFCNPFLLPNPNIRIPVFSRLIPVPNGDLRSVVTTNNIDEEQKKLSKSAKRASKAPQFVLTSVGEKASLSTPQEDRIPIFPSDLQRIILRASLRNNGCLEMRCGNFKMVSNVSGIKLLLLEGLSLKDVESCPDLSAVLKDNFSFQMECIMPTAYEGALLEELVAVPLTYTDRKNLLRIYGSLEVGLRKSNQIFRVLRAFFPINNNLGGNQSHSEPTAANESTQNESTQDEASSSKDESKEDTTTGKFSRTHLLLSAWQMIEEGYPLPLKGNTFKEFENFGMTKPEYKEVSSSSPMYALDCEMCLTSIKKHELTRVSIINEKHELIYDSLVMPPNPIINYLTEYSGVTMEMMEGVTTTLQDVQEKLREILEPDAILVGQSLNSDLVALQLMHPYVIDTSVIFNLSGERCRKAKLKYLAKTFLDLDIQHDSAVGHDPTEDASTALKLVQLKLAESLEFGDEVLRRLNKCSPEVDAADEQENAVEEGNAEANEEVEVEKKEVKTEDANVAVSVFRYLNRNTVNIIGTADIINQYHKYTYVLNKWDKQNPKKPKLYRPCLMRAQDELDILDKAVKCFNESFCTIAHMQLQQIIPELLRMRDEETTQRFKSIVSDFYRAAPEDSVVLIVLGGNSEGETGAVYLSVRKRKFVPVSYVNRSKTD